MKQQSLLDRQIVHLIGAGDLNSNLRLKHSVKLKNWQTNIQQYYKIADIFVLSTQREGFPNVILEAMACGTPVAAYDVTGPRDQIISGVNGDRGRNLSRAIQGCLRLDRHAVYDSVKDLSWKDAASKFIEDIS